MLVRLSSLNNTLLEEKLQELRGYKAAWGFADGERRAETDSLRPLAMLYASRKISLRGVIAAPEQSSLQANAFATKTIR